MKNFFTISLIFFVTLVYAQPTITSSWAPQIGDVITGFVDGGIATNLTPGDAGANVVWDFSTVTGSGNLAPIDLVYFDPLESVYAITFPDANLALQPVVPNPDLSFASFMQLTNDEYVSLGNATSSTMTIYTDPLISMVFPFGYEDSYTDAYAGETIAEGFQAFNNGTVTTTMDAYGSITTPFSSYSDVIRIKTEQTTRDSSIVAEGSYTISEITTINYVWVKDNLNGSIASYVVSSGMSTTIIQDLDPIVSPIPETISFSWSEYEEPSSVKESGLTDIKILSSFPNPTTDQISLRIYGGYSKVVTIVLFDELGQQVYQTKKNLYAGENVMTLDLQSIPSGHYVMQLKDDVDNGFQSLQVVKLE